MDKSPQVVEVIVEVMGVVEVIEVSKLITGVRCVQGNKSLRVLSDCLFHQFLLFSDSR